MAVPAVILVLAFSATHMVAAQQAPAQENTPAAQHPSGDPTAQTAPAAAPAAGSSENQAAPAPSENESAPSAAPAENQPAPAQGQQSSAAAGGVPQSEAAGEIGEEELRRMLVGKQLFLRGGYLDNSLSFNEHGSLVGHSPQGSYTLSGVEINKVHLTKHKVELEGDRYGLHFLGELPYEDPTKAVDRVNITPKKKVVRITIDREIVVKPKEKKEKGNGKGAHPTAKPSSPVTAPADAASSQSEVQAEIAAAPAAERPAEAKSVTTTTSPAHANQVLREALDNVFAQGFDDRMIAAMPDFWKLYYAAAAAKTDYRPKDPAVLRQSLVDQRARLTTQFEPPSNEYAQDHGVAGMCLYHVVIGPDGKPGEIAVARPIGFGLDENAVDSIRKATFQPAIKDGKPVPVMLDLIVQFRIYSQRTAVATNPSNEPAGPSLPGPYSVGH
ncbi:MAG: energy transducer TonB [Terracidiphilus sp.]